MATVYGFKANKCKAEVVENNFTAGRALISNSNGKIAVSPITSTELSRLNGVTSKVQDQIDNLESDTQTKLNAKQNLLYVLQKDLTAQAPVAGDVYSVTATFTNASDGYSSTKDIGIHSVHSDTNAIRIDSVTRDSNFSNTSITYYILFHGNTDGATGTITFRILMEN